MIALEAKDDDLLRSNLWERSIPQMHITMGSISKMMVSRIISQRMIKRSLREQSLREKSLGELLILKIHILAKDLKDPPLFVINIIESTRYRSLRGQPFYHSLNSHRPTLKRLHACLVCWQLPMRLLPWLYNLNGRPQCRGLRDCGCEIIREE